MPATLRKPDVVEIPPPPPSTLSRGNRLQRFVTQRLAENREQVSLIAWNVTTETWNAWFDAPPASPTPNPPPAYVDALAEAKVAIAD